MPALMPRLKTGTIVPTPEEDAAIDAGIAADPGTVELIDADMRGCGLCAAARRWPGPRPR